jgi:tetratricopeptide (TPR) repeat protein
MVTHSGLALVLLDQGRFDEALAEAQAEPEAIFRLQVKAIVLWAMGRHEESDALLEHSIREYSAEAACQIAEIYAARGDADRAFEWLGRAQAQEDSGVAQLQFSPCCRPIHGDPRWSALLGRLGLLR